MANNIFTYIKTDAPSLSWLSIGIQETLLYFSIIFLRPGKFLLITDVEIHPAPFRCWKKLFFSSNSLQSH